MTVHPAALLLLTYSILAQDEDPTTDLIERVCQEAKTLLTELGITARLETNP